MNSGSNVTLEGLFVKKYSGWNILLLCCHVKMTACRLAVYWMWNIFRNVHGCHRKVLEKFLNSKDTEQGVPCIL